MVEEFWVTTLHGIWHVSIDRPNGITPLVEKVHSVSYVDGREGTQLTGGSTVGITRASGVVLYNPSPRSPRQPAYELNSTLFGGHTAPIAGMFLAKESAYESFDPAAIPWDWRWQQQSVYALEAIGDNHPVFIVDPPVWTMVSAYRDAIVRAIQQGQRGMLTSWGY